MRPERANSHIPRRIFLPTAQQPFVPVHRARARNRVRSKNTMSAAQLRTRRPSIRRKRCSGIRGCSTVFNPCGVGPISRHDPQVTPAAIRIAPLRGAYPRPSGTHNAKLGVSPFILVLVLVIESGVRGRGAPYSTPSGLYSFLALFRRLHLRLFKLLPFGELAPGHCTHKFKLDVWSLLLGLRLRLRAGARARVA